MISTPIFISVIALLSIVQCIYCLDKTGTNVGATKPNKNKYVVINESESQSKEETNEIPVKESVTSIRSFITKPVDIIWRPIKGVLQSSMQTAVNMFNSQTKSKPMQNVTK